jgi:hypothetical protein
LVKFRSAHGPEYYIQEALQVFLTERGWLVERMVGNAFQYGIPDLYCYHPKYGQRWIDPKNPDSYEFTKHQKVKWPIWDKFGVGIWIITAADESEYDKLFHPPNWRLYWKEKYDVELAEFREAMGDLFDE